MESETEIQQNKDWNLWYMVDNMFKDWVRNGNPTKQGLKLLIPNKTKIIFITESETEIQQNKDWNCVVLHTFFICWGPKRKSNKTRIETGKTLIVAWALLLSETEIQQNKDWNLYIFKWAPKVWESSETEIQQNKDWNLFSSLFSVVSSVVVRNGNPTKQGLKRRAKKVVNTIRMVRNGNPTKQGLKLKKYKHLLLLRLVRNGNPTKQGLKPCYQRSGPRLTRGPKRKSNKTRIETWFAFSENNQT